MQLHPVLFALLAYAIAAVVAVFVAFIVKIIAAIVQGKKAVADDGAGQET